MSSGMFGSSSTEEEFTLEVITALSDIRDRQ